MTFTVSSVICNFLFVFFFEEGRPQPQFPPLSPLFIASPFDTLNSKAQVYGTCCIFTTSTSRRITGISMDSGRGDFLEASHRDEVLWSPVWSFCGSCLTFLFVPGISTGTFRLHITIKFGKLPASIVSHVSKSASGGHWYAEVFRSTVVPSHLYSC